MKDLFDSIEACWPLWAIVAAAMLVRLAEWHDEDR